MLLDPEERITVEEALTMYTRFSAIANMDEADRGTLEVGKLGDLALLSTDVDRVSPEELGQVQVMHTIVNGNVVFSRRGG
jgi:predicted amidohydrolase YtcJ